MAETPENCAIVQSDLGWRNGPQEPQEVSILRDSQSPAGHSSEGQTLPQDISTLTGSLKVSQVVNLANIP